MLWHKDSSAGTKGSDNGTESSFSLLTICTFGQVPMGLYVACKPSICKSITETTAEAYALCTWFFLVHHLVEDTT